MKVPLEWLKEYVTVRLSPKELADQLTMAGLEVTGIETLEGGPVLDVEVTPNRPDCLSILGIAREVAAMTEQRLKLPIVRSSESGVRSKSRGLRTTNSELRTKLSIVIEDRGGCQRYIGRLIDGVRIGSSPDWMQRRLRACGIRPINNVVDITNYVLLEYGQPLHAFDADRLNHAMIRVRRAKPGEQLTTLDGEKRKLSPEHLVIADALHPIAVAGVMGGTGSEVTEGTTRILLESALFDPVLVRRTARALGIATESSYRFERGVDPEGVARASARAISLIQELAGGIETTVVDAGIKPVARATISLDPVRLSRRLGHRVEPSEIRTGLARLGCRVASESGSAMLRVAPPSARLDLTQDVDLHEEIARLIGYETLPATLPSLPMAPLAGDEALAYRRAQSAKCLSASLGLTEVITWSLVSEAALAKIGYDASVAVRVSNPLSQDQAFLRPSLLPGMLQVLQHNTARGAAGVNVFELGAVVPPGESTERTHLGILLYGAWTRDWRKRENGDFFLLKGLLQQLLARLCRAEAKFRSDARSWTEPGQSAILQVEGRTIGVAGEIRRAVLQACDVEEPAWFAELAIDELLAARRPAVPIAAPSAFPAAKRDLSLFIANDVGFDAVERVIREAAGPAAARIELIDRFAKGAQAPAGRYSLTFSIEYRDPTRTMTAAEADSLHQRVREAVASRCGAVLR